MFTKRLHKDRWRLWINEGELAKEYKEHGKPCESTILCPCNYLNIDGYRIMDPRLQVIEPGGVGHREYYPFHSRMWGNKPYGHHDIW